MYILMIDEQVCVINRIINMIMCIEYRTRVFTTIRVLFLYDRYHNKIMLLKSKSVYSLKKYKVFSFGWPHQTAPGRRKLPLTTAGDRQGISIRGRACVLRGWGQ